MKKLLAALLFAPALALAAGAAIHLDKAPNVQGDNAALQSGARTFVNYCLNCHGASFARYSRLTELGLTEQQVRDNLMFTAEKIGETMRVAARPEEQKRWFGAAPPDLTLIARARSSADGSGADWLYTYLRSFYVDEKRPTGWNNVVFENVGMPHVLGQLQGVQVLNKDHKLELLAPGSLSAADYDKLIGDLVGFMVWLAEPHAGFRKNLGFGVLAFLVVFFGFAYALKKAYWKDVK
ncbi:MAG TPA: cytochrome c1 [Candidatus Accumulibacter phosphatis]|nr:MAG: Cytochrome c1 precursor [Candidatus Accumulibacter sp. SK-11]HAY26801.1 cytochrome c1 [Accumulibacter sp.]HRL74312.1 cytochrome c1 [Candidatus Accumulibacter phosphatis]HCN69897.1 cytochrome c1 [Accumulibacter sp.]HCV13303.1 cytochrome c1 [Accumulibacter sp.]